MAVSNLTLLPFYIDVPGQEKRTIYKGTTNLHLLYIFITQAAGHSSVWRTVLLNVGDFLLALFVSLLKYVKKSHELILSVILSGGFSCKSSNFYTKSSETGQIFKTMQSFLNFFPLQIHVRPIDRHWVILPYFDPREEGSANNTVKKKVSLFTIRENGENCLGLFQTIWNFSAALADYMLFFSWYFPHTHNKLVLCALHAGCVQ